jgi:hypothetical protein
VPKNGLKARAKSKRNNLFLLVAILSETLFALVRGHLVTLAFFTAWHKNLFKSYFLHLIDPASFPLL